MEEASELRVLLVEDEPADAVIVRRKLAEIADATSRLLTHATSLGEGLDRLGKGDVDVVLLDLNLPDSAGVETIVRLRAHDGETPLVALTGMGDEATALAALRAGAQDYLVKDELSASLLHRSIRYAVERVRIQRHNLALQAGLEQAQRLESLTALSLGLSWALKCEIGTIDEALDEFLGQNPPERLRDPRHHLTQIRRSTHMLAELTRGLRYFAGGDRPRLERLDLSALVSEFSDFLEAIVRDQADLNFDLQHGLPRVQADPCQLRHAVANLVVNAAEAKGADLDGVVVRTVVRDLSRAYLSQGCVGVELTEGPHVCLEVADRGEAVEPASLRRLFEPCFTQKTAGRGMGLASVLGVVRAHGGAIRVESRRGSWTTFSLLLPPAPEAV